MNGPVALCLVVLTRYDLLAECLRSASQSTLVPDVIIFNNGRDEIKVQEAAKDWPFALEIYSPAAKVSLAEAWNWLIKNTLDGRIVCSDDITFASHSIQTLAETEGPLVSPVFGASAFACFKIMDSCVDKVGYFDEAISPGYLYFEDCDYTERMRAVGLDVSFIECGVNHVGSATLTARTPAEMEEHHQLFKIAQGNYLKKWGKMPEGVVEQL